MTTHCQFKVAYGSAPLDDTPTYTDVASKITRVTTRRGRQYLTDKTDAGTCDAEFVDTTGSLDPTNASGGFYPMNPNAPALFAIRNPVTTNYVTVFQGLLQGCEQTVKDGGAQVNRGTLAVVDMFSLLALKELPASTDFADQGNSYTASTSANTTGDITYAEQNIQDRFYAILADCGIPSALVTIFSGNVRVQQTVYSPGYSTLAALQDTADAEFPGIANLYVDKTGILTFHGRLARFDSGGGNPYGIQTWSVGDKTAVGLDSGKALVAATDFTLDRDINKVINTALFTPKGIADADIAGQLVTDATSITNYGPRTLTGQDLLTAGGTTGTVNEGDPLAETLMFSQFYVDNFKNPQTRISSVTLRPVPVSAANASAHWNMICNAEIGDVVAVSVTTPYGTGFGGDEYFIEGISYTLETGGDIPNVTMTLDLSPKAFYTTEPTHWDGT